MAEITEICPDGSTGSSSKPLAPRCLTKPAGSDRNHHGMRRNTHPLHLRHGSNKPPLLPLRHEHAPDLGHGDHHQGKLTSPKPPSPTTYLPLTNPVNPPPTDLLHIRHRRNPHRHSPALQHLHHRHLRRHRAGLHPRRAVPRVLPLRQRLSHPLYILDLLGRRRRRLS